MTLGADVGGVVVPSAIIAFNVLVIVVALLVGRRRGRRGGRRARKDRAEVPEEGDSEVQVWKREHGKQLDAWMHDRESLVVEAQAGARPSGEPDRGLVTDVDTAIAACPDPELRASIMALRDSGEAAVAAFAKDRAGDGEEAYGAFQRHRAACVDRLEQLQVA